MARMTLREAADRTSRSITTLRRYIRSGKLRAEKRNGRYGPEYFVSEQDLDEAGLHPVGDGLPAPAPGDQALVPATADALSVALQETVPLKLYQELQMKHEQLLVQYGMVRVGGMRVLELQAELDEGLAKLERAEVENESLREQVKRGPERLVRKLRESELEIEGQRLEIAALREKLKGLEMLTRNSVTTETIERQFARVMDQMKRVDRLTSESRRPEGPPGGRTLPRDPEH
jgi:hypothetical protein